MVLSVCGLLIETIRGQKELLIAYFACAIVTLTRCLSVRPFAILRDARHANVGHH